MFKCAKCGLSVSGMKPVLMTVQTREMTYAPRGTAYQNPDGTYRSDPGGVGYEIVKQVQVHDQCPVYAEPTEDAQAAIRDFRTSEMAIFNALTKVMAEQASK